MKFNKIFITTFMLVVLTIGACSSEREVMSPQQPAPAPTAAPAIATAPPPSAPLAPSQPSAPDQPAPAAEPAPTSTSEPVTDLPVVENKKQSVGSEFTEVLSNILSILSIIYESSVCNYEVGLSIEKRWLKWLLVHKLFSYVEKLD